MFNPYDDAPAAPQEHDTRTLLIRSLNDGFRLTPWRIGSELARNELVLTRGVVDQGAAFIVRALSAVRDFTDFSEDNDPHGEHDFGTVEVDGQKLFWKIDYYDSTLTWGAEDPSDPTTCRRVLTIMLAEEY